MTVKPFAPEADLATFALTLPCVTRCTRCDWQHHGTIEAGRDAHVAHRWDAHQLRAAHRHTFRPRRQWSTRTGNQGLADNIAGARAQGAAGWAGEAA